MAMKIVVAGGSGFLGEPLVRRLIARGNDVAVLTRNVAKVRAGRGVEWDARTAGAWTSEVADADAVVNLAGENIGEGRWTESRKRELIESRLNATNAIVAARPRVLVNASAIGLYGNRGDEVLDESFSRGSGFLADLVSKWESAARAAEAFARVALPRFGVVLASDGGALAKMLLPFKLGGGGPMGNGQQWMSWVDRDDAVRFVEWAIDHDAAQGAFNVTAPDPVRNREFARELGAALHRPAFMPAPAFALRLAFGREMADEVLLGGQRVVPVRAAAEGFAFEHRTLRDSLQHQLKTA
jgi:uncharacterized protein (TIGR01777 family)